MEELYKLKKMLCDELEEYGRKGDMSTGTLDIVDKLAHAIKNLDKIIESEESEGSYRGESYDYDRRRSYRGNSYARKRDSRGRYPRDNYSRDYSRMDGYSRNSDTVEQLRDMMDEIPDQHIRNELQKIVSKMETM